MQKVKNYRKAFLIVITITTLWFCSIAKAVDTVEAMPFNSDEIEIEKQISTISSEGKPFPAIYQLLLTT